MGWSFCLLFPMRVATRRLFFDRTCFSSPTIDLGLVCPDGTGPVSDIPDIRHCDVRYSVFYGTVVGDDVHLDHVVVSSGKDFFNFFQRFGGKVLNKKLQIPLPGDFFD